MEPGIPKIRPDKLNWHRRGEKRDIINIPTGHLVLNKRHTKRVGNGPTYLKEFSKIYSYIISIIFNPRIAFLWKLLPTEVNTPIS